MWGSKLLQLVHGLCIGLIGINVAGCNARTNNQRSLNDAVATIAEENRSETDRGSRFVSTEQGSQVVAQGRLQPATGIVRLSALPGDRIESVAVEPGQQVTKGQSLLTLESRRLRLLELEAARAKLNDANLLQESKLSESQAAVDAGQLKLAAAEQQYAQAVASRDLLPAQREQLDSLQKNIKDIESLRSDPTTRAAIGNLELETKRAELRKAQSALSQSELSLNQAVDIAKLQVQQASELLKSAKTMQSLTQNNSPKTALEKQIQVLELQANQSLVESPIDGVILTVNAVTGERSAQLPLIELADLKSMVCVAEVHEADVARVSINDSVQLRSAALPRAIRGHVIRIERSVGSASMRFPNPMARSDFRSVQVWIAIEEADAEIASQRLQLQVDVSISPTR